MGGMDTTEAIRTCDKKDYIPLDSFAMRSVTSQHGCHSCQQSRFFLDCSGNEHLVQVSRRASILSRFTKCMTLMRLLFM